VAVEPDAAPACARGGLSVHFQIIADVHAGVWRTSALRGSKGSRVGFGDANFFGGERERKVLGDAQHPQLLVLWRPAAATDNAELMGA